MSCVDVRTQVELDAAIARGDCAHLNGDGYFRAFDSATVEASGSATVEAFGSATVEASGSATVEASGSATVRASKFVAVQDHGPRTRCEGGVIISIRRAETAGEWCDFYGVEVVDGVATLFKAVGDDWRGSRKTSVSYAPGSTPEAPDWDGGKDECGGGLHFSPRPFMALAFCPDASRFVACPVRLSDVVVHKNPSYPEKVKARGVCAPVYEVDIDGERIVAQESAA